MSKEDAIHTIVDTRHIADNIFTVRVYRTGIHFAFGHIIAVIFAVDFYSIPSIVRAGAKEIVQVTNYTGNAGSTLVVFIEDGFSTLRLIRAEVPAGPFGLFK